MISLNGYKRFNSAELKTFQDFKNALRQSENSGNWKGTNKIGCVGAYQFCNSTYNQISKLLYGKVINKKIFQNDSTIQDTFLLKLIQTKFSELIKLNPISFYLNLAKNKYGENITVSGLYGAMHLGGAGGLHTLLVLNKNRSDGNTRVSDYLKKFSGYDFSFIQPEKIENKALAEKTKISITQDTNILYVIIPIVVIAGILLTSNK